MRFCPYCEQEAGYVYAGGQSIAFCTECDVTIEGHTVSERDLENRMVISDERLDEICLPEEDTDDGDEQRQDKAEGLWDLAQDLSGLMQPGFLRKEQSE